MFFFFFVVLFFLLIMKPFYPGSFGFGISQQAIAVEYLSSTAAALSVWLLVQYLEDSWTFFFTTATKGMQAPLHPFMKDDV